MTDPASSAAPVAQTPASPAPAAAAAPGNPLSPAAAPAGDGGAAAIAAAADSAAPAAPAESGEWYGKLQNEAVRTWAEAKGFKDPLAAVESAYNLEKLIGFDKAGKTVIVPDDKSTPEQIAAFRTKIGVPEKAESYQLPVPEGIPPELATAASSWFLEAGVPVKAAQDVVGKWNALQLESLKKEEARFQTQSAADLKKLEGEWGNAYDQNLELGRRAAAQYIPTANKEQRDAILDKIQHAVGTEMFVKIFANAGQNMSEHKVHSGGDNQGIMTPAQAKQKIAENNSNKEYATSYLNGDKAKQTEMTNLHKMAYPESQDAA